MGTDKQAKKKNLSNKSNSKTSSGNLSLGKNSSTKRRKVRIFLNDQLISEDKGNLDIELTKDILTKKEKKQNQNSNEKNVDKKIRKADSQFKEQLQQLKGYENDDDPFSPGIEHSIDRRHIKENELNWEQKIAPLVKEEQCEEDVKQDKKKKKHAKERKHEKERKQRKHKEHKQHKEHVHHEKNIDLETQHKVYGFFGYKNRQARPNLNAKSYGMRPGYIPDTTNTIIGETNIKSMALYCSQNSR